ncbi:hypothetical protein MOUN0_F03246 [Monosporozyma unispora]|nr:hypothetical protein C6P44_002450 [Kazachstania unispora]
MPRKFTKLQLNEWDLETLFEFSTESDQSKEEISNIVGDRDTIRTSTRLPQSKIEDTHLEDPEKIDNKLTKMETGKEVIFSRRVLRNSGGSSDNMN